MKTVVDKIAKEKANDNSKYNKWATKRML
jgi:hypothetical protein